MKCLQMLKGGSLADCDFEQNTICSYHQLPSTTGATHDDMDWTLKTGPDLERGTGPNNDHTLGTPRGTNLNVLFKTPLKH